MITDNTLFILGAGAHVPYGFPDAKGLKEKIISEFPDQLLSLYNSTDEDFEYERKQIENSAKNFTKEFNDSGIYSIDLFLSLRPEFETQGKWTIILSMLKTEIFHSRTPKFYNKDDWFLYLYNKTLDGIYSPIKKNHFFENKIAFLTFNYDRMIENYFAQNLKATYNLSPEELFQYFEHLKIKHIYGSLAPLPTQLNLKDDNSNIIPLVYASTIYLAQINRLYNNIKIINEERSNCENWSEIISSYSRIFFLGFSYAEENMKALNIPGCLTKGQKVFGTAYRCSPNEISNIREKFHRTSWMNNSDKDLIIYPVDNLTLIRDYL